MSNENHCMKCNTIIPENRHICLSCEGTDMQTFKPMSKLAEEYRQLEADYIDLDKKLRNANTENDELIRLLSLAATDLKYALDTCEQDMLCDICDFDSLCKCKNFCYASKELRKWRHHDEAMKLIGGNEDGSKDI